MRVILRQLMITVLFIPLPFLLILGLSFWHYPISSQSKIIDSGGGTPSLYRSTPMEIILGSDKFQISSKPKLLYIGASNVREGFRVPDSNKLFPNFEAHNLSMGGSNITQIKQVAAYVGNSLPKDLAEQAVFVIGIWYGNFVANNDRFRSGKTNFEDELTRSDIYRKVMFGFKKENSHVILKYFNNNVRFTLIRPFLLLGDYRIRLKFGLIPFVKDNIKKTANWIKSNLFNLKLVKKKSNEFNIQDVKGAVKFMKWYMHSEDGYLKEEQFAEIISLGKVVSSLGSRLVLVDLPIPKWHSDPSPHFKYYQKVKTGYIKQMLQNNNAEYINLQNTMVDDDFADMAHPKRESALKLMESFKMRAHLFPRPKLEIE
jgi:hypothetical protein